MVDDCCPHEVVSSLVSVVNCSEQEHHVLVELTSVVPVTDLVDSLDYDLIDDFSRVSVDQGYPTVNHVSLLFEGYFDGLKHFNALHDVIQSLLLWFFSAKLVHEH